MQKTEASLNGMIELIFMKLFRTISCIWPKKQFQLKVNRIETRQHIG